MIIDLTNKFLTEKISVAGNIRNIFENFDLDGFKAKLAGAA